MRTNYIVLVLLAAAASGLPLPAKPKLGGTIDHANGRGRELKATLDGAVIAVDGEPLSSRTVSSGSVLEITGTGNPIGTGGFPGMRSELRIDSGGKLKVNGSAALTVYYGELQNYGETVVEGDALLYNRGGARVRNKGDGDIMVRDNAVFVNKNQVTNSKNSTITMRDNAIFDNYYGLVNHGTMTLRNNAILVNDEDELRPYPSTVSGDGDIFVERLDQLQGNPVENDVIAPPQSPPSPPLSPPPPPSSPPPPSGECGPGTFLNEATDMCEISCAEDHDIRRTLEARPVEYQTASPNFADFVVNQRPELAAKLRASGIGDIAHLYEEMQAFGQLFGLPALA